MLSLANGPRYGSPKNAAICSVRSEPKNLAVFPSDLRVTTIHLQIKKRKEVSQNAVKPIEAVTTLTEHQKHHLQLPTFLIDRQERPFLVYRMHVRQVI